MAIFKPSKAVLAKTAILNEIRNGTLRPGDRVPPERDLCRKLGVCRVLAGTALRELAQEGWLERRVGDGTYVGAKDPKRLANRSTRRVGFIATGNNPITLGILDGAYEVLPVSRCELILKCSNGDPGEEMRLVKAMLANGMESLLVMTAFPSDSAEGLAFYREIARYIPVVFVDCFLRGDLSAVATDNVRGGQMTAEYLMQARVGAGSFWVIRSSARLSSIEDRTRGFCEAMQTLAGIRPRVLEVSPVPSAQKQAAGDMLKIEVPRGVFLTSELLLPAFFEAVDSVGIAREELSVCCFDNFHSLPPLYSAAFIEQPLREMAIEATRCLLQQWQHPDAPAKQVRLSPKLVPPPLKAGPSEMEKGFKGCLPEKLGLIL